MAAPCIITYKGKKYSYENWINLLHDGELDNFVSDGKVKIANYIPTKINKTTQPNEKQQPTAGSVVGGDVKTMDDFDTFKDAVAYNVKRTADIGIDESEANYGDAKNINEIKSDLEKAGIQVEKVSQSSMSDGNYASFDGDKIKVTDENIPLQVLLHEIGEKVVLDLDKAKQKIEHSNNIFEAVTTYGASRGNDAFADNFYLYFLSPQTLKDLSPNVYAELDKLIPQNIKDLGKSLMSKYGVKEQTLKYNKPKAVEQSLKETPKTELTNGVQVELPSQMKGGLPRVMEYNDGKWKQKVGRELTEVSEKVQEQAQAEFEKNGAKDVKFSMGGRDNLSEQEEIDKVSKLIAEAAAEGSLMQVSIDENAPTTNIPIDPSETRPEGILMNALRIGLDFIKGSRIGIGMSDWLRTGDRKITELDVEGNPQEKTIRDEGGIGYPFKSLMDLISGVQTDVNKIFGWAGINKGSGTRMITAAKAAKKITGKDLKAHYYKSLPNLTPDEKARIEKAIPNNKKYGIVGIFKMGVSGLHSNEAFSSEALRQIETKLSKDEKVTFFKAVEERLNSLEWTGKDKYLERFNKAKNFAELDAILKDPMLSLDVKSDIMNKIILSTSETESKEGTLAGLLKTHNITMESITEVTKEPQMDNMKENELTILLAIDPTQEEPFNDKNRVRHNNYPYAVRGFPIGVLTEGMSLVNLSPNLMGKYVKQSTLVVDDNALRTVDGKVEQKRVGLYQDADGLWYAEEGKGSTKGDIVVDGSTQDKYSKDKSPLMFGKTKANLIAKLEKKGYKISESAKKEAYAPQAPFLGGQTMTSLAATDIFKDAQLTPQERLVRLLQKAFPNIVVEINQKGFDAEQDNLRARKLLTKGGKAYGFIKDGKVYLDPSKLNNNTPIHEFGHIWSAIAKESTPKVYQKGLDLVANTKYEQAVLQSPEYQKIIKELFGSEAIKKDKNSGKIIINNELKDEALLKKVREYVRDEALNKAIGDRGELFVNEAQRTNFKNWLNLLYTTIKKITGISASKNIQGMNLNQFLDAVVADLLGGKKISDISSEELSTKGEKMKFSLESETDPNLVEAVRDLIADNPELTLPELQAELDDYSPELSLAFDEASNIETKQVVPSLIKALNKSFLNIGTEILANSKALLDKVKELGGGVMYSVSENEITKIVEQAKKDGTYLKAPNGNKSNLNEKQWAEVRTKAFKNWFGDWQNDPKNASKVVDENGEPMVVYHGSGNTLNEFDKNLRGQNTGAESAKKGFFVSSNKNVAETYRKATIIDNPNLDELKTILSKLSVHELKQFGNGVMGYDIKTFDNGDYTKKEIEDELFRDIEMDSEGYYGDRRKLIEKSSKYLKENKIEFSAYKNAGSLVEGFLNIRNPLTTNAEGQDVFDIDLPNIIDNSISENKDGVWVENVYDSISYDEKGNDTEESDILVFFEPNQIKSATDNVGSFSNESNNIQFHIGENNEILGFTTSDGKIYLNGEKLTAKTTLEESGHVWLNWANNNRNDLYQAGMAKIDNNNPYLKAVTNNPSYQEAAAEAGFVKGTEGYNNYMKEEALAKAIADEGAKFATETRKKDFKQWLNDMWSEVAKYFGIRGLSAEQVAKLSLQDFSKMVAADVLQEQKAKEEEQKEKELAESRFNKSLRDDVKAMINPIGNLFYEVMPNEMSEEMARELIRQLGYTKAKAIVLDAGNDIKGGVREQMFEILISMADKEGEKVELIENMIDKARESGRFLQAMGMMSRSPEGIALFNEIAHKKQVDEIVKSDEVLVMELLKELAELKELQKKYGKKPRVSKPKSSNTKPTTTKPKVSIDNPKFGENNKVVTQKRKDDIVKKLRGMSFANAVPIEVVELAAFYIEGGARSFAQISKKMIKDIGVKVKPYLKEAYQKARNEAIKEGADESEFSSDKDIDAEIKNAEDKAREFKLKSIAKAYESRIENISKSEAEKAIEKSKKDQALRDRGGYLEDLPNFDDDTIRDWGAKNGLDNMTDQEVADFRDMAERYNEQQTINKYKSLIGGIKTKTKALANQVAKTKAELEKDKENAKARREANGGNLEDLTDLSDKSLRDWLAKKGFTNVSDNEINALRDLALDYKKEETKAKLKSIAKAYESKLDKLKTLNIRPPSKNFAEKLQEIDDVGGLDNNDIMEMWAEANGLPPLTAEDLRRLKELATKYKSEESGFRKARILTDMYRYTENLKGTSWTDVIMAVKYANMLSSHMTQLRNALGNFLEFLANTIIAFRTPKSATFGLKSFKHSVERGLYEALSTIRTGYSPLRENAKVDIPSVLEYKKFKIPYFNTLKYVKRLMVATDVLFYETNKEFSAYRLAYSKALLEGANLPNYDTIKNAMINTGYTDSNIAEAKNTAKSERDSRISLIRSNPNISAKEKEQEVAREKRDYKLRVYEILEEKRDKSIITASSEYALKSTFNNPPEGAIGAIAMSINSLLAKKQMLKLVFPFVNVPANILNRALDYTPYGIFRALTPSGSLSDVIGVSKLSKKEFANNKFYRAGRENYIGDMEKGDLLARGILGTAIIATLSTMMWDDDDDDAIEVIGNIDREYSKVAAAKNSGIEPYTIRIGKKDPIVISYKLSTLAPTIAFAGAIHDYSKYKKESLIDANSTESQMFWKKIALGTQSISYTMLDNSFLKSADQMYRAISEGNRNNDLQRFFASNLKSTIAPNELNELNKQFNRIFDLNEKETNQEFGNSILRGTPIAEQLLLKDKINVLGEKVRADGKHEEKYNKLWTLMGDKGRWVLEPKRMQMGVTLSDKEVETYNVNNSKGSLVGNFADKKEAKDYANKIGGSISSNMTYVDIPMTDEQWYAFVQLRGDIITEELTNNYQSLKDLTPDAFAKEISNTTQYATTIAKADIILYKIEKGKLTKTPK